MRRFVICFIIVLSLTSCAALERPKTLTEIKGSKQCIEFKDKIEWKQVSDKLGKPLYPLPIPTTDSDVDLTKNTRVYENTTIIFYVEPVKIIEGGKSQYKEVVTKIEICN